MILKLLYGPLLNLFGVLYLPHFLKRLGQTPDKGRFFRERFGYFPNHFDHPNVVWLHAVSVGEVLAAKEFVRILRNRYPQIQIVLSTTTPTGQVIAKKWEAEGVRVIYFPFDFLNVIKRALDVIQPKCIVIMETEIWPNLIGEASRRKIPIGIINGRISDRAFKRYLWLKSFFAEPLGNLSYCLACHERDKERFIKLGVSPDRVKVTGNMKFDQEIKDVSGRLNELRELWHLGDSQILIGGSTHAGEEEMLIGVFGRLRTEFPKLKLVLAPRHVERSSKVVNLAESAGYQVTLASQGYREVSDILVLDLMGVLSKYYGIADLVFVGGSLIRHGGQNPIEVARERRAILHGPYVFNFEDVYERLNRSKGALLVHDASELYRAILSLLKDSAKLQKMGSEAFQVVEGLKGASQRNYDLLKPWLLQGDIVQESVKQSVNVP